MPIQNYIRAQEVSLGDFIRSCEQFILPSNQRNYEWGARECETFWADIWNIAQNECPIYFLGSFVIDASSMPKLTIVDGQQRVTTALILVATLRNRLIEEDKLEQAKALEERFLFNRETGSLDERVRLKQNVIDREFFYTNIIQPISREEIKRLNNLHKSQSLPESNKKMAACLFEMSKQIQNVLKNKAAPDIEYLANTIAKILDETVGLIRIDVEGDVNAFTVFETLNDRGVDLNSADLLKNYLIAKAEGSSVQAVRDWDTMSANLVSIDHVGFLMHHWNSSRKYIEKKGMYKDIKEQLGSKEEVVDFCAGLARESGIYAGLMDTNHHIWNGYSEAEKKEICKWSSFIKDIGTKPQYLVLLAAMVCNPKEIINFLEMMAIFTFRFGKVCNNPPSKIEATFSQAAIFIRENPTVTAEEIFNRYFVGLYPDDEQFIDSFIVYKKQEARVLRFILAMINDHYAELPELTTHLDPEYTTLEHILPKNYNKIWGTNPEGFPEGGDAYIWRLGNLTLLPEKVNGDLGNDDFATKKKGYADHCLEISKDILEAKNWSVEEIEKRQTRLAHAAAKIWCYPKGRQ